MVDYVSQLKSSLLLSMPPTSMLAIRGTGHLPSNSSLRPGRLCGSAACNEADIHLLLLVSCKQQSASYHEG